MIESVLNIFYEYKKQLSPLNLNDYETNEYKITFINSSKIITYFEYYQYKINKGLSYPYYHNEKSDKIIFTSRQKRLQHDPFSINITITSEVTKNVIIRLFIGPNCDLEQCLNDSTKFFEIDNFKVSLNNGKNIVIWSSNNSSSLSYDNQFNYENKNCTADTTSTNEIYSMFKFPERLIIPKGSEEGTRLKLFVIVTNADTDKLNKEPFVESNYKKYYHENDMKPYGFPFHKVVKNYNQDANNYRFYDLTIYHRKTTIDSSGYFSPHLY